MRQFILNCLLITGLLLTAQIVSAQDNRLEKLVLLKKGFDQNHFPAAKSVFNFAIMEPGVVLVPIAGGVYIAGWKKWFLSPSKASLPFAVDYCTADSSFYLFATNKTKSYILKSTGNDKKSSFKKILDMPLGIYGLKAISPQSVWIWGQQDESWCLWKFDSKQLKLIFKTELAIKDVAPLSDNNVVVATTNSIITLGVAHAPKEIIKMDTEIDGLAVHSDGTLFVSTGKGIVHYLSPEFVDDAEVVTYGIHGTLRRHRKSLYVLWREDNQVLEIKL